jgi:hypothetical protein
MKSSWAISHVRCLYLMIPDDDDDDDDDRDGPQNISSIQTPDAADSLRRLH